jgi:predicted nicotinamide N-methyase
MKDNKSPFESRIIKEYIFGNYAVKLEQINDVDKLIDEISDEEFGQDERFPYWANVWPSALALSDFILKNKNDFKNKNVLELGCGIGLVGIVASIAEAKVTFSDYEKDAINFTQNNYFLNFKKQADAILMDWREPINDKSYEIIIAADILYEKRFLKPVFYTIQELLQKNGKAYIAEPDRSIAMPFFEMMQKGFELQEKKTISSIKTVTLYIYKKC